MVIQEDAANPNACVEKASVFSSEDLRFIQIIVEELLAGLTEDGDRAMQADTKAALKTEVARHVFEVARPGDRDAASLKKRVMQSRLSGGQ